MNAHKKTPAVGETAGGKSKNSESTDTLPGNGHPDNYGALSGDWTHFDLILGLTEDLLPVVSNPKATKSPLTKIDTPGKTPTQYNKRRQFTGFSEWTKHKATLADITKWMKEPDYGICLQTRRVRAIDVDVSDFDESTDIEAFINAHLGFKLPCRRRGNSSKFAMLFTLPGEMPKRRFKTKTEGNFIEMLGSGQQIIVAGTHTSGVRYEWEGGLPDAIPELTAEQFESLWTALHARFGSEDSVTVRTGMTPTKKRRLEDANDPVGEYLEQHWTVHDVTNEGRVDIVCPFEAGHSTESTITSTSYYLAGVGGFAQGHFKCQHTSCAHRTDQDFLEAIGYLAHGFDVIEVTDAEYNRVAPQAAALIERAKATDTPVDIDSFFSDLILTDEDVAKMADAEFLIDNLIVRSSLHTFVAPANGGKTTLFIHLCEELAARGLKIYYINADASPPDLKRHQAHASKHRYAVLAPDAKAGKGPKDAVGKLKALNESNTDLNNFVIILDTLKKFTTMLDKSRMSGFLALMRGLSSKGATVILLAHTNKRTEDDGKHIFEGTGDLRNDSDHLIYLESSKDEAKGVQEITTRPDKVRAEFKPVSYVIDFNDNRKVSKCGSVLPVLDADARAVKEAAEAILQACGQLNQTVLVKYIKEQLPYIGEKRIRSNLLKLTHNRIFNVAPGESNAVLYSFAGSVDNNTNDFDDLSDHGGDGK